MNLQTEIARRTALALARAFPEAADADPLVAPAQNEAFGDYQSNVAMSLAKRLRQKPRDVAQAIVREIDTADMLELPEIAGPGFINFRLTSAFLGSRVAARLSDDRLGIPLPDEPRTVIVDFSSPNTCKPMHVGHVRSTVIGDAICRLLRLLGHRVIADNHLGDWGTQFGLLIAGFDRFGDQVPEGDEPLDKLVEVYKRATACAEEDEAFRETARAELAKLQRGDEQNLQRWRRYTEWSMAHFRAIYERLGVRFDEILGESSYNDMLPGVVAELEAAGLARESEGAICVFWPDDDPPPMVIRKSDGAFLYATTDLATIKYRKERWDPDEVVYVTDGRQQLHFRQLFSVAERWGVARGVDLRHVWFGTIMGPDGRPFKTRSGDLVPLQHVLDEAERRAREVVREKNPELDEDETAEIARTIGIGAIKYADLSQNRQSDFVFNWDRMLALQGNTAPYLQYAYARIRSIFRKGQAEGAVPPETVTISEPAERALAMKLLRLPEALASAEDDFRLNLVTTYLYELSQVFTGFYESCPVLASDDPVRSGRLALCDLAARTLRTGLETLGIGVVERM